MVRISVLGDSLKTMYNAEKRGKRCATGGRSGLLRLGVRRLEWEGGVQGMRPSGVFACGRHAGQPPNVPPAALPTCRQVMIRPASKVVIKFLQLMQVRRA
jgi:hypothetical protein